MTLRPEVRLLSREGDLLYAKGETLVASRRFCKDDRSTPSVDSMVEELAGGFGAAVRADLAPVERHDDIRVLESRTRMSKADQATFKTALRLTKTDTAEACAMFGELKATNPQSVTILFNVGLCIERLGELDTAAKLYQQVLALKPGKIDAQEGLARFASRSRAERQLFKHYGDAAR